MTEFTPWLSLAGGGLIGDIAIARLVRQTLATRASVRTA